jgi:dephospho-CoA kinase
MRTKPVIGLIGGIGSGKSAVAAAFARQGARVVEGDRLGHEALCQPEILARVAVRWPTVIGPDGQVQRRKLAEVVFADAAERKALEEITHPYIKRRIAEEVAAAKSDPAARLVVIDAAVMLEADWDRVCDRLVFVEAPPELRRRRVADRGWSAAELEARERAQLPLTAKAARADHVLANAGTLEEIDRQVCDLLRSWGAEPPPS